MIIKAVYCAWMILLKCTLLVCSANIDSLDFELIDDIQNDDSDVRQSVLQEEQTLESSYGLDMSVLSNAVNTVGVDEEVSASASLSLPSTSTTTAISSVQVQPSAGSAKRVCDRAVKEDGKQRRRKRQKTNTTTSTATETNTALMGETEVRIAIEKFNKYFEKDTKISSYMPRGMLELANNLGVRGLTSVHSREIVELCTASEEWLGNDVFWRMLLFFVNTMSLEVVELNRLEDKKTVVLRDRIRDKPFYECVDRYIRYVVAKFRGAERIEMQCSLGILEDRGTADVLGVLRWLLHHVKIECIEITCDLTEMGMSSTMFGRQVEALSKEWRGTRVRIDSLALHFGLAQYMAAAEIINLCSWITVLKMHFINAVLCQDDDRKQVLETLLLHCPAIEHLSVFGLHIRVEHIRTIVSMLPQLVLLEVGLLSLEKLALGLEEEKEFGLVFSGLKTLKIQNIYSFYSDTGMEKFVELFPNLEGVQIPSRYVTTPLIDVLSSLRFLRSLEIVNGSLSTKTIEYLLGKLPTLEWLSVGVKYLDNKLAHALSKCTAMHTLMLRGRYIPGFLGSLLQPSSLMTTLKVLCVWRYSGASVRRGNLSAEDKYIKKAAIKKFGCAVEINH
ncbi:hypothetical protein NECID01_1501 [Nematocida sp. AWRm77]|nr:hypothetical protein NECID01_1501 [Nematocida sp. AWRm77]